MKQILIAEYIFNNNNYQYENYIYCHSLDDCSTYANSFLGKYNLKDIFQERNYDKKLFNIIQTLDETITPNNAK